MKDNINLRSHDDKSALANRRKRVMEACEATEQQITALQLDQATFRRFANAVASSPETASTHFPHSVATWYAQSVLVRLRRIGDRDSRSNSLYNLLAHMRAHSEEWALKAVIDLWNEDSHPYDPETLAFLAHSSYAFVADSSGDQLDIARIDVDLARIEAALQAVKILVDRTIAHADSRGARDVTMTYDDVGQAIAACEDIALPYIALITGRAYSSMTPVDQTDWWKIFETWT